jgi:hypothetical protein
MSHSDIWHRDALGKSTESVWKVLLAGGAMKVNDISKRTGRVPKTVRRALDKLWMYGLATPIGDGYWTAEPADDLSLKNISEELGTLGLADRKKAMHEHERSNWVSTQLMRQKVSWENKHRDFPIDSERICKVCKNT